MQRGRLILCERTGRWAAALRQALAGTESEFRETRSLVECREALAQAPAALVAVELTATHVDGGIHFLANLDREFPAARAVALAGRELSHLQWLAREAGALDFITSPRRVQRLAELAQRFFASLPREELPLAAQVLARLPWNPTTELTRGGEYVQATS